MQEFSTFNGYSVKDATVREQLKHLMQEYASHEENKNNPHGMTREQIGAAPSGFGLGENAKSMTSADSINANGYYRTNITVNGNAEECVVLHNQESSEYAVQEAISIGNSAGTKLRRTKIGGTWKPWEFVNPPMVLGVEYRTTERFEGKPVFAKLFDGGSMPNNSYKSVVLSTESGNLEPSRIVDIVGSAINTTSGSRAILPMFYDDAVAATFFVNTSNSIVVQTYRDMSAYTAKFLVRYTES